MTPCEFLAVHFAVHLSLHYFRSSHLFRRTILAVVTRIEVSAFSTWHWSIKTKAALDK